MTNVLVHSAAGQLSGYLYQCDRALIELARTWFKNPQAELRMECLDDIVIRHEGRPTECVQVKRHKGEGELSPTGADLWRTLNGWCDVVAAVGEGPLPLLRLVTTQRVGPDNPLAVLCHSGAERDTTGVQRLLESIAADPNAAATTASWRARFLQTAPAQRASLVGAIVLDDQAPQPARADADLQEVLGIWKDDTDHVTAMLEQVRGWWATTTRQMLDPADPRRVSVCAAELRAVVDHLQSSYGPGRLPLNSRLEELTENEIARYADRVFVAQLTLIGAGSETQHHHIHEYHHAALHRSRWLHYHYVTEDELAAFETDIRQEHQAVASGLRDAHRLGRCEEDAEGVGRKILTASEQAVVGLALRQIDKRWIARGTLQALANLALTDTRPVGWHPDFKTLLTALAGPSRADVP